NFDGNFESVDTLAHELGHAFHDRQVQDEPVLLRDYPMPVAETASTFNEVHLGRYAMSRATGEEALALLESSLSNTAQCVVDIYSRYLFETAVFEESGSRFLMADDLNEIMLRCQEASYGEGLDPEIRHPYMWLCKSHYYSSGLSFYNFPYTFGNLFAEGLYAVYRDDPEGFMPRYREMLRTTPVHTMEENGRIMGLDLTDKAFWKKSLQGIEEEIERFCKG
ncbi:MAG: peptidase M3, partial [Lachnospiraceae bacterium]|nr:peptidase M3 [Lachnospiraceae bacterium]